ncbi:protein aurora borealis-like [Actinia tenebrosa]|uniref:Protein aurora borealis n=1 Tax=Actinia tenebrosa TaxID=6105 RepID=A0A6P8J5C9_ACTTE|nr:protein aurora borealis-like [Actinia tenebrosa]
MSDSQTSLSSMEITRNPFDSDLEGKLNFPGFSPSMFTAPKTPETPVNKKKKEFRWSIEQISRLYPVDMDEYPNQEYSSTYEREEDEKAAQDAIDEYFSQDAIVPSPWTPNRSAKHVTFSPLPPDTQYIAANDCSMESSYSSQSNSVKVDAGTQTALSFPWNVDLEEILGSAFQTFMHNDLDNSKDLSGSSFIRRKLFPHEEQTERIKDVNNNQENHKIRSILKASKSPTLTTSSPVGKHSEQKKERTPRLSTPCPDVSPIRSGHITPLNKLHSSKAVDGSFQASNVLESSGIEQDLDMFPDISPIKDDQREYDNEDNESIELQRKQDGGSHCIEASPLKLSALDAHENQEESNFNNDDDDNTSSNDSEDSERPAKITMEDLANESSVYDEQEREDAQFQHEKKPPRVSMEDLQSPDDISMIKETSKDDNGDEAMETSMTNILSSTKIPDGNRQNDQVYVNAKEQRMGSQNDEVLWEDRRKVKERFYGRELEGSGEDLDDDMVMIKASAALRRANRVTQSVQNETENGVYSKSYNYSISNMNVSEFPWQQPVGMSTPLTVPSMRPRGLGSSFDNDYNRFETRNQFGGMRNDVFSQTSYHENRAYQSENSAKRLTPVVEDVIRRKEILKSCLREVQSTEWTASTPAYKSPLAGKWRTPRTYPLSYADRKAIYGRPSYRIPDYVDAYSPQLYTDTRNESKRTSWPPSRSFPPRLHNNTRPLSPTNWPSTSKIYSANPEGYVSRMPLPSHYTHTHFDSGFDEWKKSVIRWEKSMRIQSLKLKSFY